MSPQDSREESDYNQSFLSGQHADQLARLRTLESLFDPLSKAVFDRLELPDTFTVLDVGAGAGSFAGWLARRYPCATVVATDIETRFLVDMPGIQVLAHNVVEDDFPSASFDVVHFRALLCHLPEREAVLTRALNWLRPGGWIVIEDVSLEPSLRTSNPLFRKVAQAGMRLMKQSIGSDMLWAEALPERLRSRGLSRIGVRTLEGCIGDDSSADTFWAATVKQAETSLMAAGLLTKDDLVAMAQLRADPAFTEAALTLISAWGQRV